MILVLISLCLFLFFGLEHLFSTRTTHAHTHMHTHTHTLSRNVFLLAAIAGGPQLPHTNTHTHTQIHMHQHWQCVRLCAYMHVICCFYKSCTIHYLSCAYLFMCGSMIMCVPVVCVRLACTDGGDALLMCVCVCDVCLC